MEENALTIASFPSNALDPVVPSLRLVEDARWYSGRDMMKMFFPCRISIQSLVNFVKVLHFPTNISHLSHNQMLSAHEEKRAQCCFVIYPWYYVYL